MDMEGYRNQRHLNQAQRSWIGGPRVSLSQEKDDDGLKRLEGVE